MEIQYNIKMYDLKPPLTYLADHYRLKKSANISVFVGYIDFYLKRIAPNLTSE